MVKVKKHNSLCTPCRCCNKLATHFMIIDSDYSLPASIALCEECLDLVHDTITKIKEAGDEEN